MRRAAARGCTALVAFATLATLGACGDDRAAAPVDGPDFVAATIPGRADFQWVIPLGTAAKVNIGTHDGIFPAALFAKVGQSIRIINEDIIGYTVGPFYVGPKQTMEQVFRRVGTFEGECTTHRGQRFALVVER